MNVEEFYMLSKALIETSFNLLFNNIPCLLSISDMFIDYN